MDFKTDDMGPKTGLTDLNGAAEKPTLDTSKLEPGMVVKNYKELCTLLGEPVKTGNAKKSQLKEWNRYFSFSKVEKSNNIIIAEIYQTPQEKIELRGRTSKYLSNIEIVLCDYLLSQKGFAKSMTKNNWYRTLGLVAPSFKTINKKYLENSNPLFTSYEIDEFYLRCSQKFDRILETCLKSMADRRLITYKTEMVVVIDEMKKFVANEEDEKELIAAENHTIVKMGFNSISEIYLHRKSNEYYQELNNYIHDLYGYDRFYRRIRIVYAEKNIRKRLTKEQLAFHKRELNHDVIEYINQNAHEKYEKWTNTYLEYETNFIPKNYIEAQEQLALKLLELNSPSLLYCHFDLNQFYKDAKSETKSKTESPQAKCINPIKNYESYYDYDYNYYDDECDDINFCNWSTSES